LVVVIVFVTTITVKRANAVISPPAYVVRRDPVLGPPRERHYTRLRGRWVSIAVHWEL